MSAEEQRKMEHEMPRAYSWWHIKEGEAAAQFGFEHPGYDEDSYFVVEPLYLGSCPRVKEIEWRGNTGFTPFGHYRMTPGYGVWLLAFAMMEPSKHKTEQAAKAAAQADFDARVMSVLYEREPNA